MNYFAHGRSFIDHPYLLAGTAVPDWLNVVARRSRIRTKHAQPFVRHRDHRITAIAVGILCHHRDDDWFHRTRAFAELSWSFTAAIRDRLPRDDGLRPSFLGHILVELLLDAELAAAFPRDLDAYYRSLDHLDVELVGWVTERMAPRPVLHLADFIPKFSAERFLYDYSVDAKLLFRLNAVMRRVKLPTLPEALTEWFPWARQQVRQNVPALLTPWPQGPDSVP